MTDDDLDELERLVEAARETRTCGCERYTYCDASCSTCREVANARRAAITKLDRVAVSAVVALVPALRAARKTIAGAEGPK